MDDQTESLKTSNSLHESIQPNTPQQDSKRPLIIVVGIILAALVLLGGYWLFNQNAPKNRVSSSTSIVTPVVNQPLPTSSITKLPDFPVYPGAKFVKQEQLAPCLTGGSGYTTCGGTAYYWDTADNFDATNSFFKEDKSNSGWKCSGGAGDYTSPRLATGTTSCHKKDDTYGLTIKATAQNTQIMLIIPQGNIVTTNDPTVDWKTYTNAQYQFSFKYPKDYEIVETKEFSHRWEENLGVININITTTHPASGGGYALAHVEVWLYKNDALTLSDWITKHTGILPVNGQLQVKKSEIYWNITNQKPKIIAGQSVMQFDAIRGEGGTYTVSLLSKDPYIVGIILDKGGNDPYLDTYYPIILSTFKFTE